MRRCVTVLAISLLAAAPHAIRAQVARVGRLPVLEPPADGVGSCRTDPVTDGLRRGGVKGQFEAEAEGGAIAVQ